MQWHLRLSQDLEGTRSIHNGPTSHERDYYLKVPVLKGSNQRRSRNAFDNNSPLARRCAFEKYRVEDALGIVASLSIADIFKVLKMESRSLKTQYVFPPPFQIESFVLI